MTAKPDSHKKKRTTTLQGPREIEIEVAKRLLLTGAAKVTEIGNENIYLTTLDAEKCFCKCSTRDLDIAPDGGDWIIREPNKPAGPHSENGWQHHFPRA